MEYDPVTRRITVENTRERNLADMVIERGGGYAPNAVRLGMVLRDYSEPLNSRDSLLVLNGLRQIQSETVWDLSKVTASDVHEAWYRADEQINELINDPA